MDKAPDAFRIISEVADDLDVPQHVLRFWETRFSQIRPMKRSGGRRYYRPDDVELLRGIRHLLYGQGYTIRGVQRILREQGVKAVQAIARGEPLPPAASAAAADASELADDVPALGLHPVGRDDNDDAAVPLRMPSRGGGGAIHRPLAHQGLAGEDVRRLAASLDELLECRRILMDASDGSSS